MNELTQTPSISVNDGRLSEGESISSRQVETLGAKGLQNYKNLSENISFSTAQVQRAQNNQTQISMNIDNKIQPSVDKRINQVKTSHSHRKNHSGICSPAEVEEDRIRQINNDLIVNSRQITNEELSCRNLYAPR